MRSRPWLFAHVALRSDMKGISHSVQFTPSSLYEAVALGLKAIRPITGPGNGGGFGTVQIATDIPSSIRRT